MILVMGNNGFLGSAVSEKLRSYGIQFVGASRTSGTDFKDWHQTALLFENARPKVVINCAAHVGGIQYGVKYPADIFCDNLVMITNLFRACKEYGVSRLINPISNCAYPGDQFHYKEENFWDGPMHNSVVAYGYTRKALCVGADAFRKQYGLDTINLVFPNLYGPRDHFDPERSHAMGALISKIICAKHAGVENVIVWGSGTPVREWMHVDDAADALIKAMKMEPYGDIINVGVGTGISIREMAELIQIETDYRGNLIYDESKPDGAPYKTMDGTRGSELLKWKPSVHIRDGIKQTIEWYKNNARCTHE